MRLSFYTYSYTDRLKMPTVECLERIARTGYTGIDVSGTHGPSEDPKSFDAALRMLTRKTAERLNLRIEAVITHATVTDSLFDPAKKPLDLKGSVDLAVDLGAPVMTFHLGGVPKGLNADAVWKRTVSYLREACDYGADKKVRVAVDGIWPEWLNASMDAQDRLTRDIGSPHFGINFDPCYLAVIGLSPIEFARRFNKQLVHCHLKDYRGRYPKFTHFIPGKGDMEYASVFRTLAELKWPAAAAVECFTDMKFEEACDDGFAAMTAAAAKGDAKFER